jgi:hypothetical protein
MKNSIFLFCLLVGLLFSPLVRGQELKWSKDGTSYYGLVKNEIYQYTLPNTNGELLVSTAQLSPAGEAPLKLTDFSFSEDGKKLLLFTNTKPVWRLQTQGDYYVYELESKRLTQVGKGLAKSSLRFAKFSPDATQVAYVSDFNLYTENLNTGQIYKNIDLAVYSETSSTSSSGIDGRPEMAKMIIYENILYLQLQRLDRNDISGFPSPNTDSYILKINIITDEIIGVSKTLYPNPYGKMQKITLGSENFIAVCLPSRLGFISQLDGGIGALNIATGEFRTSPLYSEKDAGGDILDMVIKSDTEGFAYVLDSSFNKSIQRFNPSTGEKTGTLATYTSNLGNISGLALSQTGKLFLGSAEYNNPGITVFETANGELRQITPIPISVGLRPFDLEVLK